MGRGPKKQEVSCVEKLYIIMQPYLKKHEIRTILNCTIKRASAIFDEIILNMKRNGYRIIDYQLVPTKMFLEYCGMSLEEFVQRADIEKQILKRR
jgi:hypothetical protein